MEISEHEEHLELAERRKWATVTLTIEHYRELIALAKSQGKTVTTTGAAGGFLGHSYPSYPPVPNGE